MRLGRTTHGTALYARVPLRELPSPTGTWNAQAVALADVRGTPVELAAVHPAAPFSSLRTRAWRDDIRTLPPATPDGVLRILVGDFNATLDHAELRRLIDTGYRDAADQVGAACAPPSPSATSCRRSRSTTCSPTAAAACAASRSARSGAATTAP